MTISASALSEPPGRGAHLASSFVFSPQPASPADIAAVVAESRTVILTPDMHDALLALNEQARAALPDGKKHYLKEITPGDLASRFSFAVGTLTPDNELIAGMLVTCPENGLPPITGLSADKIGENAAVFRSVMVKPGFTGHKLSSRVITFGAQFALASGKKPLAAICVTNGASEANFGISGFFAHGEAFEDTTGPRPYWKRLWKHGGPK